MLQSLHSSIAVRFMYIYVSMWMDDEDVRIQQVHASGDGHGEYEK